MQRLPCGEAMGRGRLVRNIGDIQSHAFLAVSPLPTNTRNSPDLLKNRPDQYVGARGRKSINDCRFV